MSVTIPKVRLTEDNQYINFTFHNNSNQNKEAIAKITSDYSLLTPNKTYKCCIENMGNILRTIPLFSIRQLEECYISLEEIAGPKQIHTLRISTLFQHQNSMANGKCYSVEQFLKTVNRCLFNILKTFSETDNFANGVYFTYSSSDTETYELCIDDVVSAKYKILMSEQLYNYIGCAFDTFYYKGKTNANYEILLDKRFSLGTRVTNGLTYQVYKAAYPTRSNLYFYDEVFLTMRGIPTLDEQTGYFSNDEKTASILTSFKLANINFKSSVVVLPIHYRYVNIQPIGYINNASITLSVRNIYGEITPVEMAPYTSLHIRLKVTEN